MKARVFLVDDHDIIREALTMWVERTDDLEVVGQASNVIDALQGISESSPDVVVVDLELAGESGVAICEAIRVDHPHVKSLILTGTVGSSRLMEVIAAGASGYALKTASMPQIMDVIRDVAAGKTVLATAAAGASVPSQSETNDRLTLSDQEERVLRLVAAGLTNQETARRLNIATQTVKNHVSHVLKKLGVESRTQAALYVARRHSQDS